MIGCELIHRKIQTWHNLSVFFSESCWAVIAIGVLEAVWECTYHNNLMPLSPQMLVDCVNQNPAEKDQDRHGCYVFTALKAFQWLMENEVFAEQDYHYKQKRGKCKIIKQVYVNVMLCFV